MPDNAFGEYVRQQRTDLRLNPGAFSEEAGVDPGNANRIERGEVSLPGSAEVLDRIASALQLATGSPEYERLTDLAAAAMGAEDFLAEFHDRDEPVLRHQLKAGVQRLPVPHDFLHGRRLGWAAGALSDSRQRPAVRLSRALEIASFAASSAASA